MSFRKISGLKWAQMCQRPECIPRGRPRGVKKQGVLYERKLAEELGSAWLHGQWFEYEDLGGHGYCQVDFLRRAGDATVILEAKLSWLLEAHDQINQLYRPVVECVWGVPVVGVVVAKRLVPGTRAAIAQTLPSALEAARTVPRVVLHWTGKSSLFPAPRSGLSAKVPLPSASAPATLQ